jgi:adenylyltransferase/sulfurtransferase
MLPQVDIAGQQKLLSARVLIVGAGGLGSPAAMYLAAAGIGHLVIADHDVVELSNLQRQLLHHDTDVGHNKAASAQLSLATVNPDIRVTPIGEKLQGEQLEDEVRLATVVLDCTDNFASRFAINSACVRQHTPLVSGAAIRLQGQLCVFDSGNDKSPCYSCLYKEGEDEYQSCADTGVLAPITGIIGTLQALEALKVVLSLGQTLVGRQLVFDGSSHEWRTLKLNRDPDCPVCGQR